MCHFSFVRIRVLFEYFVSYLGNNGGFICFGLLRCGGVFVFGGWGGGCFGGVGAVVGGVGEGVGLGGGCGGGWRGCGGAT